MMIRKVLSFLVLPLLVHASLLDWFSPLSPKAQRAQTILNACDPMIAKAVVDYEVPGIVVGVVVDGHVVYSKGFGYRNLEEKLPMTPDTLMAIGSCTKAFTSFVMGTLVDQGLVAWDDLMIDLIPDFRLWDKYATQNVTIRDLLTHRSGMPRHDAAWYNSKLTRAELMSRLRYLEPSTDIRERYQYNHIMYSAVGYAMEKITGKDWEQLVKERILAPLHMSSTNFSFAEMNQSADFAHPYLDRKGVTRRMPGRDVSLIGPGASINSNINDMVRWMQMILNEGIYGNQVLISPTTLEEICSPQVIVPGAPEVPDAIVHAYGMGWHIYSYRGLYVLQHDGATEGYTCSTVLLPKEGVGVIVLSNKNLCSLPAYLTLDLINRVMELPSQNLLDVGYAAILKAKEMAKGAEAQENRLRKKGTAPSHSLEDYEGIYEHPGYGSMEVEVQNGQLLAHFNGITSTLEHWHYDVFAISEESQDRIVPMEGTKFTFRNDSEGNISELLVPFEPGTSHIAFQRTRGVSLSDLAYLRKFCGTYEIYGHTVEIVVRNHALYVIIPTYPIYELLPTTEDRFSVKEMLNWSIRFIFDDNAQVKEALVELPYGTVTATPKNRL